MSFEAANDFKYTLAHKHNVLYLTLIEANALPCPISFIKTAAKCLSNIGGTMKFISQTTKNIPAILCYKKKDVPAVIVCDVIKKKNIIEYKKSKC